MPRYDYKCNCCGYTTEVEHSMSEDYNGDDCLKPPYDFHGVDIYDCDGEMYRVFQATPAHFKGQGWANKGPTYKSPKGQD